MHQAIAKFLARFHDFKIPSAIPTVNLNEIVKYSCFVSYLCSEGSIEVDFSIVLSVAVGMEDEVYDVLRSIVTAVATQINPISIALQGADTVQLVTGGELVCMLKQLK